MKGNGISHDGESVGARARCPATITSLVVDNDNVLRLLSATVPIRSGYQVDTVGDGGPGWEALQTKKYDLLITEKTVPKGLSVELVKQLRSEERYAVVEKWWTMS